MASLSRRDFLQSAALATAALATTARAATTGRKPNVLYIITDQQRKDTLGCYGNSKVQTPAFDEIAARGVTFTSAYATQPVCSPARSSMATGLFPNATGVVENKIPLRPDILTWPSALHDAGYQTAYIGKWHLGDNPVPNYFDVWKGFDTGWDHWVKEESVYQLPGETQKAYKKRIDAGDRSTGSGKESIGRYRPDLDTDHAINFIRGNAEKPFACWLSFYPPHTPKTAPDEDLALYKGKFEDEEQDTYHAMVHRVDTNIGRILRVLDELNLREDTLILFTSDHGENFPQKWNEHHKRLCYDQSANVPLLISWPSVLPEGTQITQVISVADLAPTLLDLLGQPIPVNLHGDSAKKLLAGDAASWHEDVFIQNSPYRGDEDDTTAANMRERAIVSNEWKLILNTNRDPELFPRDPATPPDTGNQFGKPDTLEITRHLAQRLQVWAGKTGDTTTSQLLTQWSPSWA